MIEIEEAEEEGVIFLNLTNPLEIISDENGHCRQTVSYTHLKAAEWRIACAKKENGSK